MLWAKALYILLSFISSLKAGASQEQIKGEFVLHRLAKVYNLSLGS